MTASVNCGFDFITGQPLAEHHTPHGSAGFQQTL
jgi:hypothetical protein